MVVRVGYRSEYILPNIKTREGGKEERRKTFFYAFEYFGFCFTVAVVLTKLGKQNGLVAAIVARCLENKHVLHKKISTY